MSKVSIFLLKFPIFIPFKYQIGFILVYKIFYLNKFCKFFFFYDRVPLFFFLPLDLAWKSFFGRQFFILFLCLSFVFLYGFGWNINITLNMVRLLFSYKTESSKGLQSLFLIIFYLLNYIKFTYLYILK